MQIFLVLLTVLFIYLKLASVIAWSWLWVLAPLWVPAVIAISFLVLIVVVFKKQFSWMVTKPR